MKFKKEDLINILHEDYSDEFTIVSESDWKSEHKYQYKEIIFKFNNKLYAADYTRSGSPFTDYYYDHEDWNDEVECDEVEPVEVKTIIYRKVEK